MGDTLLNDDQFNAMRIVLVGKTGCGKSATANTILGERKFESKISAIPVTLKCQKAFRKWKGKNILVVDTPGFFDTKETLVTTCREISKCILYSSPGPHAIILVLQLNRLIEEEQKVFAMTKALFGEKATRHMIVLFTRKEDLEGRRLRDFIAESNMSLKNLIEECGNRCCAFNNRAMEAEQEAQMQELMQLIERMIFSNAHFTDNIYKDVEERLKQKADALVKIFTSQLENETKLVKEDVSMSQKEKEKKIKLLKEKHVAQVRNIREETEMNIFHGVFSMISSLFSRIWSIFVK